MQQDWPEANTPVSLIKSPLRLEVKRLLSISAPPATKVELVASPVTLTTSRLGVMALYLASRACDMELTVEGLDDVVAQWAELGLLAGGEPVKEALLISGPAMRNLMTPVPVPVPLPVVASLQRRISLAVYRLGELIGRESRRQSVSFTTSLAHLVMGRLLVNQARVLKLPGCYVALANMTPSAQVKASILEVSSHNL